MATPKGGYRNAKGIRVPSVTTVIGRFKDSSGLIKWAYRQGREHEHLRHTGGEDPGDLYAVTKKAADAGSIAHDMIERHILSGTESDAIPAQWEDAEHNVKLLALNSYRQFVKWQAQTRIRVIETETGGVSEQYQYGGTFDGVGEDSEGKLVLIDWKTSNAVYEDYLVQLAAYAQLILETSGRYVTGFHLLRVRKESADFSHHYWGELDDAWEAFKHMRSLYDLMYALKKRV
jgi:tRNA(Leu) C34 or U34 (ribose-2'-O)-methylase TrmL